MLDFIMILYIFQGYIMVLILSFLTFNLEIVVYVNLQDINIEQVYK